jgi:CubicO group peptidase (beta-lactamase class C family)
LQFIAWHGRTLADHVSLRDSWAKQGYRFVSLSVYGATSAPVYAAVMVKRAMVVAQHDWPLMTAAEWQQTFDQQAAQGFGPVMLTATGSASDPRFAAVFQELDPIPLTRHGLASGAASDQSTIQGMNEQAKKQGLILRWAASYGTASDRRFAAIWMPNSSTALWNNDGVLEDAVTYQQRFNALTAAWCRPAFVTPNADNLYLSVFVADEIGQYVARHDMTPEGYQAEFDTWTKQGFFPLCVQAAGTDAGLARFAALFARNDATIARQFTATGPVANTSIDDAVRAVMAEYPVARYAALAIVKGTKLVYARGYTLAEPDWPLVQPTTYFRLASASKTVTALAIYQLIEAGKLVLTDTLQGILNLSTPAGQPPTDANFAKITIQNLLEHTSGLSNTADGFSHGPSVVSAFTAVGKQASLPVTQAMTDSYIASLLLANTPGAVQNYSNGGYYLLGRVVAHLYGTAEPIDAYRTHLLSPLAITRIRGTMDLLAQQPPGEARYQTGTSDPTGADIPVGSSIMSPDQPTVASGYGDWGLGISQGAGGLSGAAVDVARLVAALIDQNDTAAMKRSTLTSMLTAAADMSATGASRAGYGLDYASDQGSGSFYGQKGGSLGDAASVIQFNGGWGFVAVWGSQANNLAGNWYPDFDAVMNIATAAKWAATDLFPQFGMPSL